MMVKRVSHDVLVNLLEYHRQVYSFLKNAIDDLRKFPIYYSFENAWQRKASKMLGAHESLQYIQMIVGHTNPQDYQDLTTLELDNADDALNNLDVIIKTAEDFYKRTHNIVFQDISSAAMRLSAVFATVKLTLTRG